MEERDGNKYRKVTWVMDKLDISHSGIYELMDMKHPSFDPDFPRPRHLGARRIRFLTREVEEYMLSREVTR